MYELCLLCGSDDVSYLAMERLPVWRESGRRAPVRVDSYCEPCGRKAEAVGGRLIVVRHTLIEGR